MDTSLLLQRQMELHGTLRRPPHTPEELKETHETLKELVVFFGSVRFVAKRLESSPETVFQCLMHIGLGDAVSFDMQRRDGVVPMHQAKVLTRAKAIALEPRLREILPAAKLDAMVQLSKRTRALLRIKVEDGNDFSIAENALQFSVEYLDFIETASGNAPETMFRFYMVEDQSSLLRLMGRSAPDASCGVSGGSDEMTASAGGTVSPLPSDAHLDSEVHRLAQVSITATGTPGERLRALQIIEGWLRELTDECFSRHFPRTVLQLVDPLSVCATEKRSAICRQACAVICVIAGRTPAAFYHEKPLRAALTKWCSSLLSGIVVTVLAIAHATDTALRALVVGSKGHPAALRSIVDALEGGTHHELRRKSLGYIALGIVASRGEPYHNGVRNVSEATTAISATDLSMVARKYMETGDAACRKMARVLYITLSHFTDVSIPVGDKKVESLIQQETPEIKAVLDNAEAFEKVIFGTAVARRLFTSPSVTGNLTKLSVTEPTPTRGAGRSVSTFSHSDIYDTHADLTASNTPLARAQVGESSVRTRNGGETDAGFTDRRSQPSTLGGSMPRSVASQERRTEKLSSSLRRKIEEASSRSLSRE